MQEVNESPPIGLSSEGLNTFPLQLGNIDTNRSIVHGCLLIAVALFLIIEPHQLMTFFATEIASRYVFILAGSSVLTLVAFVERWIRLIFIGILLISVSIASQFVVVTSGAALTIALAASSLLYILLVRVRFHKHVHWPVICTIFGAASSMLIFAMKFTIIPPSLVLPTLLVVIAIMFIVDLRRR